MNATCGGRSLPSRAAHIWDGWAEGHVGETAHPILLGKPSEAEWVTDCSDLGRTLSRNAPGHVKKKQPLHPLGSGRAFVMTLTGETYGWTLKRSSGVLASDLCGEAALRDQVAQAPKAVFGLPAYRSSSDLTGPACLGEATRRASRR
jgi:hypothetical protein